jgi:hypothetical protein
MSETKNTAVVEDVNEYSKDAGPTQDAPEYPSGAKLAILVTALIITIFLVALDMVRLKSRWV